MSYINVEVFLPAPCRQPVSGRVALRSDATPLSSFRSSRLLSTALLLLMAGSASHAQPQPGPAPRVITLDDALRLAEPKSELVTIAEAGVTRAESEQRRVHSEWLPQVSALASYDRARVRVLRSLRLVRSVVHTARDRSAGAAAGPRRGDRAGTEGLSTDGQRLWWRGLGERRR